MDDAPCGFVSFTDRGTIREINRTLLTMLARTREATVGRSVEELLSVASRIFFQTHLFPLLKGEGRADEVVLTLRGGVPVMACAVRQEVGRYDCVLLPIPNRQRYEDEILRARREAEAALQRSAGLVEAQHQLEAHARELERKLRRLQQRRREIDRVIDLLSHHLQEPVRKTLLFTDILRNDLEDQLGGEGRFALDRLVAQATSMDELLRTLREFLLVGTDEAPMGTVSLGEALRRAAERTRRLYPEAALDLRAPDLPQIVGIEDQIEILFANLLENSVRFAKPGAPPVVRIECALVQQNLYQEIQDRYRYVDFVRLTYRDNSRGFDPRYTDQVFDLLARIETAADGLGLNLAVCRKIVEGHYGEIRVQSSPGVGLTFTILLPTEH